MPLNCHMYALNRPSCRLFPEWSADNSAAVNPAQIVNTPPISHASDPKLAVPVAPYTAVGLKKTPAPITVPITVVKATKKPISFLAPVVTKYSLLFYCV